MAIVVASKNFARELKRLYKKHASLKEDLQALEESLIENPRQGTLLLPDTYKIRLAIKSKGKGKSGGARVITYVEVALLLEENIEQEEQIKVRLITIYDKADMESIDNNTLRELIQEVLESEQSENE